MNDEVSFLSLSGLKICSYELILAPGLEWDPKSAEQPSLILVIHEIKALLSIIDDIIHAPPPQETEILTPVIS